MVTMKLPYKANPVNRADTPSGSRQEKQSFLPEPGGGRTLSLEKLFSGISVPYKLREQV